ncbi:ABC-2 family transporter protein [Alkalicella caledoniensis]|uniref:ABC-2 family transporter protein n=1 Tax=Alkalicella caledoniensis TaxID=2731377 RepID=A0A7G9W7L1_ALKCA|nr:ABC-2 family transporter protein [Alkalicella caledoniensis]QNO14673.1 ABC-2 family transporter protein [Alkalicella caledoniensis]
MGLKGQLRFLYILFKLKLARTMAFRFSFFGAFFVDGIMFLIQLLMFSSIYSQVDSIGGWDRQQMLFFIGTFSLINALNMTFFFFGIISIPHKISSGQLDLYITKPVKPLLYLSFENINLGSFPLVLGSIGILIYAVSGMTLEITASMVLGYIILVNLMLILYYDTMVLLRTIAFFVIQASALERLEGELITLCMKIPGVLFEGAFKVIFYLFLPYGIMATIPTQFFTESLSIMQLGYATGIVIIFTAITLGLWKLGLKNYKSASS